MRMRKCAGCEQPPAFIRKTVNGVFGYWHSSCLRKAEGREKFDVHTPIVSGEYRAVYKIGTPGEAWQVFHISGEFIREVKRRKGAHQALKELNSIARKKL